MKGLPIPDGSADLVYASHGLEHLSYSDFWVALRNTHRMLRGGGLFRLIVPDLETRSLRYLEMLKQGEVEANSWFMRVSSIGAESRPRGPLAMLRSALGSGHHLWMWDEVSMAAALRKTSFVDIRRCQFNDGEDAAFRLVEDPGRFRDPTFGLAECAMEARKPATI